MKESVKTFLKDLLAVVLGIFITFTIQGLINRSADKKDVRSSLELVRSELVRNIDDISVMKDHLYQEIGSAEYFLSHKDIEESCLAFTVSADKTEFPVSIYRKRYILEYIVEAPLIAKSKSVYTYL